MRHFLLLTYAFPPDNTPAAARPGQLYDYMPENGYQPIVVASSSYGASEAGEFIHRVPSGDETAGANFTSRLAYEFMRYCAPYNDRLPWVPYAVSAAARLIRSRPVDAIYSTSPFIASHIAALWLKARFGLPWIADFQDPVRDNPFRTRNWIYPYDTLIEKSIFRNADRLIANTDTVATAWSTRYPKWAEKISILWNSFDPHEGIEPASSPLRAHRVLAHIGALYGGRSPALLLSSLERLRVGPSATRVKLVGPIEPGVLASQAALFERMRQSGILEFENRLVSREEALLETAQADYLLLLDINEKNAAFQVPSKLLDYIRFGKPILAYTPKDSPVERILVESGTRYVAIAPTTPEPISDQKVSEFLRLSIEPYRASPWFESKFSARAQAQTLNKLLNDLLPQTSTAPSRAGMAPVREGPAPPLAQEQVPAKCSSMLPNDIRALVDFSHLAKPLLLVIADAEEEFDWEQPFAASRTSVTNMKRQHLAQEIFARYHIVPTYAVDYAVANQEDGYRPLLDLLRDGLCEIGAQLHPWVTPPQIEEVGERNSFAGNLPEELEFSKLKNLTERIEANLGVRPRLYRAGRYGTGPNTPRILNRLGYTVDCSVLPKWQRRSAYAPDYSGAPMSPYWIGGGTELLEIPVTTNTIGLARKAESMLAPYVFSETARSLRVPGVLARLRLLDQIRLSPEGNTLNEAKRLTRFLITAGHKVFVISYHTPSLAAGHTPYVRNAADLTNFLGWLEAYLDFFFGEVGGAASTPEQVRRIALSAPSRMPETSRIADELRVEA
jgi:hypothetical protein